MFYFVFIKGTNYIEGLYITQHYFPGSGRGSGGSLKLSEPCKQIAR